MSLRFERKSIRVLDGFDSNIHIKLRPIEVARSRFLNIEDRSNGYILKPREVFVGHKQLFVSGKQPDSMA